MSMLFGNDTPQMAPPVAPPDAPPPPPAFGMSPQGTKPKNKSQQTTFLGMDAVPTQFAQTGFKTLLGN